MRIYSMTATFGKLEHQKLTLQPGLNIIEAPNEWGKSTWCAFLINMLYGLDTKARSTTAILADKDRYAPWSGAAMAGRIDLNWNGRDITIERSSKGRIIFGNFRAYETESGIDVPELNGLNCGQMLLGVERSVFMRSGFLRLNDLPVTQDETLRRRLNNLVTTGDESGAGDQLSEKLKDLKNKCRYNRSGLLPQAEMERDQLKNQLSDLHGFANRSAEIRSQQAQLEQITDKLNNHAATLRYEAAQEDARKVAEAEATLENAKKRLATSMDICRTLPSLEQSQQDLQTAQALQEQQLALQMEEKLLPSLPVPPAPSGCKRTVEESQADFDAYTALNNAKKAWNILWIPYIVLSVIAMTATLLFMPKFAVAAGAAVLAVGIAFTVVSILKSRKNYRATLELFDRHSGITPAEWVTEAQRRADEQARYEAQIAELSSQQAALLARKTALDEQITALAGDLPLPQYQSQCAQNIAFWNALSDARRDLEQAEKHAQALRSMARTAEPPKQPDDLSYSLQRTEELLTEARLKQRQLHTELGQCQGLAENLGSEERIRARLDTLNRRIARLEDTYYALEMAQDALRDATQQLQRRFAPRISKRAQELFEKMTAGRYQRITLGEDFALQASAQGEDTLRSAKTRSDGTVDQLYLALRLAVSEELTPDAPLILDDAFVRFDDVRLKAAIDILKEEAQAKQVILFTCQSREKTME